MARTSPCFTTRMRPGLLHDEEAAAVRPGSRHEQRLIEASRDFGKAHLVGGLDWLGNEAAERQQGGDAYDDQDHSAEGSHRIAEAHVVLLSIGRRGVHRRGTSLCDGSVSDWFQRYKGPSTRSAAW